MPELTRIKAAAEAGDAKAQYELAKSFAHGRPERARWMSAAANQDYGPAQDALAWDGNWMYFVVSHATPGMRATHLGLHGAQMQQSLVWAAIAADKGFDQSRLILAFANLRGYIVPQDNIESYKWFSMVKGVGIVEWPHVAPAKKSLEQTMPLTAVEEALRRAATADKRPTLQIVLRHIAVANLQLTAIAGSKDRQLAMVNGTTIAVGAEAAITINGMPLQVRCTRIGQHDAAFVVPPDSTVITLRVGAPAGSVQALF